MKLTRRVKRSKAHHHSGREQSLPACRESRGSTPPGRAHVEARRCARPAAVQGLRDSGGGVGWLLAVATSAVNRWAVSAELPEDQRYLKAL